MQVLRHSVRKPTAASESGSGHFWEFWGPLMLVENEEISDKPKKSALFGIASFFLAEALLVGKISDEPNKENAFIAHFFFPEPLSIFPEPLEQGQISDEPKKTTSFSGFFASLLNRFN